MLNHAPPSPIAPRLRLTFPGFLFIMIRSWKRIEVVVTSRTRNAVVREGTWVRIPPLPLGLHVIMIQRRAGEGPRYLGVFLHSGTIFSHFLPSSDLIGHHPHSLEVTQTLIYKSHFTGLIFRIQREHTILSSFYRIREICKTYAKVTQEVADVQLRNEV